MSPDAVDSSLSFLFARRRSCLGAGVAASAEDRHGARESYCGEKATAVSSRNRQGQRRRISTSARAAGAPVSTCASGDQNLQHDSRPAQPWHRTSTTSPYSRLPRSSRLRTRRKHSSRRRCRPGRQKPTSTRRQAAVVPKSKRATSRSAEAAPSRGRHLGRSEGPAKWWDRQMRQWCRGPSER